MKNNNVIPQQLLNTVAGKFSNVQKTKRITLGTEEYNVYINIVYELLTIDNPLTICFYCQTIQSRTSNVRHPLTENIINKNLPAEDQLTITKIDIMLEKTQEKDKRLFNQYEEMQFI